MISKFEEKKSVFILEVRISRCLYEWSNQGGHSPGIREKVRGQISMEKSGKLIKKTVDIWEKSRKNIYFLQMT